MLNNNNDHFINFIRNINQDRKMTYRIETFGCQMNENDSEKLAGMLVSMGFTKHIKKNATDADLVIFNTCCVRDNAEQKLFGKIGALKAKKRENPSMILVVCGCFAQQEGAAERLMKKYSHIDIVFGTANQHKLPQFLYSVINEKGRIREIKEFSGPVQENIPLEREDKIKALVTVMYGCNNFCSYCIVPYVRGRERSRDPEDIIKEINQLAEAGYKEVTLLGQNVNSYGTDQSIHGQSINDQSINCQSTALTFSRLLEEIDKNCDISRIRFMTSHPKDISSELIHAIRDLEKVCEHIHLPVQSGSSTILKAMNRKYSREQYIDLAAKIKETIPGIALTTDIIVGFPGETEKDFEKTLDLMRQVRFDSAFTFIYSRRQGTPAGSMPDLVPDETKSTWFGELVKLQNEISRQINETYNGKVVGVLTEGPSKTDRQYFTGRTRTSKIVNFPFKTDNTDSTDNTDNTDNTDKTDISGKLINVKINTIQTWSLGGITVP